MSTVIRVYCQSDEPPSLSDIVEWLIEESIHAALDLETVEGDPDSSDWLSGDILLEDSGDALQLDCVRDEGETAVEFQLQREQFENKFADLEDVGEADPVRDHLSACSFFIRLQVPTDASEEGREAASLITQNLAANESGIIHYEGEGVYDAEGEILLDLE